MSLTVDGISIDQTQKEWRRDRNHSLSKGIKDRDRCFGLRFTYLWTKAYKKAQASKRFSSIPGYGTFS